MAAPSGAGKTSLARALLARNPNLKFSVSYTTRPQRSGEVDGRDYFFVSAEKFREMIDAGAFLEHARVFDNWYGTGRSHVQSILAGGSSVLLEIDWQGARQVRERAPGSSSIFILPPTVGELERRLRGRGTDSDATIARRLRDSLADMTHWREFDHVVVNDDFERALGRLEAVIERGDRSCRADSPEVRRVAAAILETAPEP
jgi:guanylate kinase